MEDGAREALGVVAGGFHPNLAPVHVHDPLGDGEPQTCPLRLKGNLAAGVLLDVPHLVELLEDAKLVLSVDTDAGIGNGDLEEEVVFPSGSGTGTGYAAQKVLGRGTDGDAATVRGELDGVAQDIGKELAEPQGIAADAGDRFVQSDHDLLLAHGKEEAEFIHRALDEPVQLELLNLEL